MPPSSELLAVSVTGLVRGEDLGVTLPHEHIHCDGRVYSADPPASRDPIDHWPPGNLDRCRRYPLEYPDNLDMRDPPNAERELQRYRQAGGRTIVELTTVGLAPDRSVLRALSERTGVSVIAGTGFYVEDSLPSAVAALDVDALAEALVHDITIGDPQSGSRAGIIGEIGTSDPLGPTERRVVRAAGLAHLATGCPVNFHFVAGLRVVGEVFEILEQTGLTNLSSVVVSHADDVLDTQRHRSIMDLGAYVEYDTFGNEGFTNQSGNTMPSDEERIRALADLFAAGHGDHLLVSHDVCMKMFWTRYGGSGYTRLIDPLTASMRAYGLGDAELEQLFIENPRRLLCFVSAQRDA